MDCCAGVTPRGFASHESVRCLVCLVRNPDTRNCGVVRGWNPLEEARWHTAFATYATEFRQATRPHRRIAHQKSPLRLLTCSPLACRGRCMPWVVKSGPNELTACRTKRQLTAHMARPERKLRDLESATTQVLPPAGFCSAFPAGVWKARAMRMEVQILLGPRGKESGTPHPVPDSGDGLLAYQVRMYATSLV